MKSMVWMVLVAGMLLLVFGCSNSAVPTDSPDSRPIVVAAEPIPPGYGWPADPVVLGRAVARGNRRRCREHAWRLWTGINQPMSGGDLPVWWSWPTTTQLFETDRPRAHTLARRRQPKPADDGMQQPCTPDICLPGPSYPVPAATVARYGVPATGIQDGRHFQSNGDIMVATESYSAEAAEAIRRLGYDRASTFDRLLAEGRKIIPGLPPEHVVTKHMFWPVKSSGFSALPVFDGVPPGDWNVYNGYETWARLVAVDPSGASPEKLADVSFLYGVKKADGSPYPTRRVTAPVVSIRDFYHYVVDESVWRQLDDDDRAMLDAACRWAHDRPFEIGDYVVTVAMHINTKEIPAWTLQSVWWHDRPDEGPYAADRPPLPQARGPWRHYLLTDAYGIPTADGSLPVSFNPYIELAATHPVATSCRNCHMRSSWPKATAFYLAEGGPGPLVDIEPTDPIFDGLLLLDFQWVFSDRVK